MSFHKHERVWATQQMQPSHNGLWAPAGQLPARLCGATRERHSAVAVHAPEMAPLVRGESGYQGRITGFITYIAIFEFRVYSAGHGIGSLFPRSFSAHYSLYLATADAVPAVTAQLTGVMGETRQVDQGWCRGDPRP